MHKIWLVLSIVFLLPVSSMGQEENLFDYDHSSAYAKHLFQSRNYRFAAQEFERVLFFAPEDLSVQDLLLRSYLKSAQFTKGLRRANQLYPAQSGIPTQISFTYGKLLLMEQNYQGLDEFARQSTSLSEEQNSYLNLSRYIMTRQWDDAKGLFAEKGAQYPSLNPFTRPMNQLSTMKRKSPFLATSMSVLLPGSGRFYTKQWKDGLLSFLLIASLSYASYRNFNRNGQESVLGWVYGGLALGFYGGNLYGSYQSAHRYNDIQERKVLDATQLILLRNL